MMNKIGILGGTFDPIHNGHINMTLNAIDEYNLDYMIIIPSFLPPHKLNIEITPYTQRVEMCKIATEEYDKIIVSTIEQELEGISFAYRTLNALKELYPNSSFYYIIGGDTLLELNSWYRPELLAKLATFVCVIRPSTDASKYGEALIQLKNDFGLEILISKKIGLDISSTIIRECIKNEKSYEELVPKGVFRYVSNERIYK